MGHPSDRRQDVDELLTHRRLLHFHQPTAAAVGHAGFRNLVVGHGVVVIDIQRPDNTRNIENAQFLVDPDFLASADDQIAVLAGYR
jgi:hypothetical protein